MKSSFIVPAFLAAGGAIAWGVLADARAADRLALLRAVDAAEDAVPHAGVRLVSAGGAEPIRLRVSSRGGERRVEFLGGPRPGGRGRLPALDGLGLLLKPEPATLRRTERERQLTLRNYDLVPAGADVVAGREVEVHELRPRHAGRPSYRAAVDAERRLLLSFDSVRDGQALFSTRFEELTFDPSTPAPSASPRRRPSWLKVEREAVPPGDLGRAAGFPVWRPAWLPPGFELRESEVIRLKPALTPEMQEAARRLSGLPALKLDSGIAKLTYTDGLAFLAFVEVDAASELWTFVRKMLPPAEVREGKVVARKFPDRGGAAYLLELEGAAVLVAGNASPDEMETMIRTLERR